jgi:hypothetical protein
MSLDRVTTSGAPTAASDRALRDDDSHH